MERIRRFLDEMGQRAARTLFSPRTVAMMRFDVKRFVARVKNAGRSNVEPPCGRLHLGCGWRHVAGWLNVDVRHSDHDVDLTGGRLPWADGVFEAVVSQHVVEHLELETELLPLLEDVHRVLEAGGAIWLSCPDVEKICRSYLERGMEDLLADRQARIPEYDLGDVPPVHLINNLFHAQGEHRNLFDFTLLRWALLRAGFRNVERVTEADLLYHFPAFPPRHDDAQSLYVRARKGEGA